MEATQESFAWIALVLAGMVVLPAMGLWAATLGVLGPAIVPIERSSEVSGPAVETREAPTTSQPSHTALEARLRAPTAALAADSVQIEVEIVNHSDVGAYLLTWYTPLEGLRADIFRVEREGQVVPYQGPLVSRSDPAPEDYVFLEAGETLSCTVDLAASGDTHRPLYDFSEPGSYTISLEAPRMSHVAGSERQFARSLDELGPVTIPSNRVTVEVASVPQGTGQMGAPCVVSLCGSAMP